MKTQQEQGDSAFPLSCDMTLDVSLWLKIMYCNLIKIVGVSLVWYLERLQVSNRPGCSPLSIITGYNSLCVTCALYCCCRERPDPLNSHCSCPVQCQSNVCASCDWHWL